MSRIAALLCYKYRVRFEVSKGGWISHDKNRTRPERLATSSRVRIRSNEPLALVCLYLSMVNIIWRTALYYLHSLIPSCYATPYMLPHFSHPPPLPLYHYHAHHSPRNCDIHERRCPPGQGEEVLSPNYNNTIVVLLLVESVRDQCR